MYHPQHEIIALREFRFSAVRLLNYVYKRICFWKHSFEMTRSSFLNRQKTFQVSRFSGMGIMWMLQLQKSIPKRCWSDSFFLDICSLKKDAVLMTSNEYCDYKNNHLNQLQLLTYQISVSFCLTSHLSNFSLSFKWWIQSSSATCGKTKNQREKQESLTANFLRLNLWGKTSGPL